LKTSWLSREIVVFGAFAGCAALDAGLFWITRVPALTSLVARIPASLVGFILLGAGIAASVTGLLGVFCSLMIYQDTRRPLWSGARTGMRFGGTCALLGLTSILFVTTLQALVSPTVAAGGAYRELTSSLCAALAAVSMAKLGSEAAVFRHLRDQPGTIMRRTAKLLSTVLAEATAIRFITGAIGGIVLPLAFLASRPAPGFATLGITLWILLFSLSGELIERYLFFVGVIPPKMPGGVGA
jgi:DMSO reductase anchor subunit